MISWLSKSIAQVIFTRRKAVNLSLSELAAATGVTVCQAIAIERGELDVDVVTLHEICAVLGIEFSALFAEAYNIDTERIVVCGELDNADALNKTHRDVVVTSAQYCQELIQRQRFEVLVLADSWASMCAPAAWTASRINRLAVVALCEPPAHLMTAAKIVRVDDISTLPGLIDELLLEMPKGKVCSLRRMQDELRQRRKELGNQREQILFQQKQLNNKMDALVRRQVELCEKLLADDTQITNKGLAMLKRLQKYRAKLDSMSQTYCIENSTIAEQYKFARHRALFLKRQEESIAESASEL